MYLIVELVIKTKRFKKYSIFSTFKFGIPRTNILILIVDFSLIFFRNEALKLKKN